ncbi:MAG: beta-galactosidase [Roseiflexaceae bacterium]|nr:beta-galactosidase [Roseiflexaceae bacterium]
MHYRLLSPLLALALLIAWLFPAPAGAQVAPGRSDFGVNTHIASRYPVQAGFDGPVDLVAGTSAGWAREDFHWYWLEPEQGRFDWSIYDRAISRLAGSGVNIIGVLNAAPAWATPFPGDAPGRPSYYAPDPAAFARFASAVVTRYRDRVRFWQVWNEPENVRYWQPQPDPAAYAALLRAAYPAIKAADPNAVVLSAGVVPTNIGFIRAIAENGAWGSFDILALHPYVDPFSPENGQIGAGDVSAVKTLVEGLGRKPIWATEFGWSTGPADRDPRGVDEETQANFLVRASTLLRAAGIEKVIWYNLKDTESRNLYGLLRGAGGPADLSQPKPSLAAFRTLNQQLAGASPVGLIDLGARQVVDQLRAVWHMAARRSAERLILRRRFTTLQRRRRRSSRLHLPRQRQRFRGLHAASGDCNPRFAGTIRRLGLRRRQRPCAQGLAPRR